METKTIGINTDAVNNCEQTIRTYTYHFENIKAVYDTLGLRPLETKDIQKLMWGEKFIKELMLQQVDKEKMKIGGIKLSDEKILQLLDLPKGTDKFNKLVNEFLLIQKEQQHRISTVFLSDFEIVNGIICFPNYEEKIELRNTWLTSNERQNEVLDILNEVIKLLNSTSYDLSIQRLYAENAIWKANGTYTLNPNFIRRIQAYH